MQKRVKQILESKAYTPSRFADHIGVPRATISHILSGRNKPSLEVVQKILEAFPDISADWLVKGKGFMGKSSLSLFEDMGNEESSPKSSRPDIAKSKPDDKDDQKPGKIAESNKKISSDKTHNYDNDDIITNKMTHTAPSFSHNQKGKKSIKIIIMYSDGTYSEHSPST